MIDGLNISGTGNNAISGNNNAANPLGNGFTDLISQMQNEMSAANEVPADGTQVGAQLTEFSMIMFQASGQLQEGDPVAGGILAQLEQMIDRLLEIFGVEQEEFYAEHNLQEFDETGAATNDVRITQFSFIAVQMTRVSKEATVEQNEEASTLIAQMTTLMHQHLKGDGTTGLGNFANKGVEELMRDPKAVIEKMRMDFMASLTGESTGGGSQFGGGFLGAGFDPNLGMLDSDGNPNEPNTQIF